MCLVVLLLLALLAIAAAALSIFIFVGFDCDIPKSEQSCLTQIASLVAAKSAMYSATAVDNATVGCRLLNQTIGQFAQKNTTPVVECLSSLSPNWHHSSQQPQNQHLNTLA